MTRTYEIRSDAAVRAVAGEIFVVSDDRAFHHAHIPTAVDTLNALRQGPQTVAQLTELICSRYEVDAALAEQDVQRFLRLLVERQIAVVTDA